MKNKKNQQVSQIVTYWLGVISIGLLAGLSLQFARAWVKPAGPPPTGNISKPITSGPVHQVKTGNLEVTGTLNVLNGKRWLGSGADTIKGTADDVFSAPEYLNAGPDKKIGTADDVYTPGLPGIYLGDQAAGQRVFGDNDEYLYFDSNDNGYTNLALRTKGGKRTITLHGQANVVLNNDKTINWGDPSTNVSGGLLIDNPLALEQSGYILLTEANKYTQIGVPDVILNNGVPYDNPIMHLTVGGRVGIGTTEPETLLEVTGSIKAGGDVQVGNASADCTSNHVGRIKFESDKFWGCDGTAWKEFGGDEGGNCFYDIELNECVWQGLMYPTYNSCPAGQYMNGVYACNADGCGLGVTQVQCCKPSMKFTCPDYATMTMDWTQINSRPAGLDDGDDVPWIETEPCPCGECWDTKSEISHHNDCTVTTNSICTPKDWTFMSSSEFCEGPVG